MKAKIISMENCQNCATLKMSCPDVENIVVDPMDFLPFCRATEIRTMPFVVLTGDVQELKKALEAVNVHE